MVARREKTRFLSSPPRNFLLFGDETSDEVSIYDPTGNDPDGF